MHKNLAESTQGITESRLLVDVVPVRLSLVEKAEGGKILVRGEFARVGTPTENKRVYPKTLLEREIRRLEKALGERQVFGELDHPADGRTQLTRVSHLVTSLSIDENGIVLGEAEPLDTDRGRNLKALLASGAKVGVSSRGYGSTKTNDKGEEVVQDDFRLVTFDFVADPADTRAYPAVVHEAEATPQAPAVVELTVESLRKDNPDLCEALTQEREQELAAEWTAKLEAEKVQAKQAVESELRDAFAKDLLDSIARMKSEVREQVRAELLADPSVGAAKLAFEQVREILRPHVLPEDAEQVVKAKEGEIASLKKQLAESELAIKALEENVAKLTAVAKEVGYKFYLEKLVEGDPDATLIRKMVGDVKTYTETTQIREKVEALKESLQRKREKEQALQERREREEAVVVREQELKEERISKLEAALEKALQAQKEMGIQLYAKQRLSGNPQASKIEEMIATANPSTTKEVDEIIRQFKPAKPDSDLVESVRSRVRRLNLGGKERDYAKNEENQKPEERTKPIAEDYNGLGVSLHELRNLSGIKANR